MTVFILQDHKKTNPNTGELEAKFDISPAYEYGEVQYLLDSQFSPFWGISNALEILHSKLKDFTNDDFLLLTGSPVFLGLATAIAADYNGGSVNFLQWSGSQKKYIRVEAKNIFQE